MPKKVGTLSCRLDLYLTVTQGLALSGSPWKVIQPRYPFKVSEDLTYLKDLALIN